MCRIPNIVLIASYMLMHNGQRTILNYSFLFLRIISFRDWSNESIIDADILIETGVGARFICAGSLMAKRGILLLAKIIKWTLPATLKNTPVILCLNLVYFFG